MMNKNVLVKIGAGCIIYLFLMTLIPVASSNVMPTITEKNSNADTGGLIDLVNIWCQGPFWIQILLRECVFTVSFNSTNIETIKISMNVSVTKRDGSLLFKTLTPFIVDLPPKCSFHMGYWAFPDFRKAHHLFGFFDINVDFTVLTDESHRVERFHGFIFGISAIILNKEGKIIE